MGDDPGSISAWSIVLYFVLILLSAYFSGTEISLASVNRIHMMSLSSKNKGAANVVKILDNFDEALSVLLIGNNIVNIGCASLAVVIATDLFGGINDNAVSIATLITTVVIFMFGEMLPKCIAKAVNEDFAMIASYPLVILMKLLKPLSVAFTVLSRFVSKLFEAKAEPEITVTEEELHTLVEGISEDDDFDRDTGKLVKSALKFSNSTVEDVLIPWNEVEKIKNSLKISEIAELVKETSHSRLPVIDRQGRVKGILQIRRFMKAYISKKNNFVLSSVLDYPYFVRRDISLDDLLSDMSNHKRNLAIIKGENGEILGIVTVEDILEELVGEIYDENDIGGDSDE